MAEQEETNVEGDVPADDEAARPTDEATAEDVATRAASSSAATAAAPAEIVPPKERRQRARAAKAAQTRARKPRTPEERQAERDEVRARKAAARRVERQRARGKAKAAPSSEPPPPREHGPGTQKVRQGIVVSDRAEKTITVRIDLARRHRRYDKIVRTSTTLHAHDEANDANIGDTVVVRESRPLSRTKRWRLVRIVERAK